MKVVSWNLKNVSANKLNKRLQPLFASYGLGGTVLDYIVNVVMGADQWEEVVSPFPADLFVVIELKTGGSRKGSPVSGNCYPTLAALTNAMNVAVGVLRHNPNEYHYAYVAPIYVSGRHETAGFIYNTRTLNPFGVQVQRDTTTNTYLPGRTPIVAGFNLVEKPGTRIQFSAIHDPPPSGGAQFKMRPPIDYCVRLVNTPAASPNQNTVFLGDFNCQPSSFYINGNGVTVRPFSNLAGFTTDLPNNSYSSVRRTLNNANPQPLNYLSEPYDNAIFRLSQSDPHFVVSDEEVPDLIGNAKDWSGPEPQPLYPARARATLNAFNSVSDHLPVIMEFNVI